MSEHEKNNPAEDVEISPLTDEDLEGAAGGAEADCSCNTTGGSCTSFDPLSDQA
jgi:hypothetical protein